MGGGGTKDCKKLQTNTCNRLEIVKNRSMFFGFTKASNMITQDFAPPKNTPLQCNLALSKKS